MTDRDDFASLPAHDIAAEQAVLGAMMMDAGTIAAVAAVITPADHYRPAHQVVHTAILALAGRGDPSDPIAVAAELERAGDMRALGDVGRLYLHDLIAAVPAAANAGYYAMIVRNRARLRRMAEAGTRLRQAAGSSGADPDEVLQVVLGDLESLNGVAPGGDPLAARLVRGGCILDVPAVPDAIWGDGKDIFWADGQSLIIAGPDGTGKTTLAANLIRARLGLGDGVVLGLPVKPGDRNVLVLLMDRPAQAMAALARLFTAGDRGVLDERLIIWRGPPPDDLAQDTGMLARLCHLAGADTCVVDSLKDAALKLSEDETGSGWNRARQLAIEAGTQLAELHHPRKGQDGNRKPSKLDDLYGSRWIPAGAGSIVLLWGQAGDPVVELSHLKPVTTTIGPWRVTIDGQTGEVGRTAGVDLVEQIRYRPPGEGLTAAVAAQLLAGSDARPRPADVERARRILNRKTEAGILFRREGQRGRTETAWFLAAPDGLDPNHGSNHAGGAAE